MTQEDPSPPSCLRRALGKILHLLHCTLLFSLIGVCQASIVLFHRVDIDPWSHYGTPATVALYSLRYLTFLSLPIVLITVAGLVLFDAFPGRVRLRVAAAAAPRICVRIVTRGDYPLLVGGNVARNLECCAEAGLVDYRLEVVTDKRLDLPPRERFRELVVPSAYRPKGGALYKARALQYCLEDDVNEMADDAWIVHLDEETLLTVDALWGILNFVTDGRHKFGQGLITYASDRVVNWVTTVADFVRVCDDMGKIRGQFKLFHKPLFGWKGSYVVTQVGAERAVSFSHGPDGSIAEDCYFAMKAFEAGYTFDFVDGHMMEKSPFTLADFLQQRKRWLQGFILIVHSDDIPLRFKLLLGASLYTWLSLPLTTSSLVLSGFFPVPCPLPVDLLFGFLGAVGVYMYVFGAIKSFSLSRYGTVACIVCICGSFLAIPLNLFIENAAVVWGLLGRQYRFFIVEKELAPVKPGKGAAVKDVAGKDAAIKDDGKSVV